MFNLDLTGLLQNFIIMFAAITVHEYAHGFVAHKLGDPTAKAMGRLTLNPLAHLDPLGALMMIFCRFGWAKPVPVNPYYFNNPKKGMVFVSVAGPMANLALALLVATLYPVLIFLLPGLASVVTVFVTNCIYMNIAFAVFNLIPFPPLDGSKILFSLLPNEAYNKLLTYERYGTILLLALSFSGVLGKILNVLIYPILSLYAYWINFLLFLINLIA